MDGAGDPVDGELVAGGRDLFQPGLRQTLGDLGPHHVKEAEPCKVQLRLQAGVLA